MSVAMAEEEEYEEQYEEEAEEQLEADEMQKRTEARARQNADSNGGASANAGNDAGSDWDKEKAAEVDRRSVYVGNVEYGVTSADIAEFFQGCGTVRRVTVPGNKDGHPKGYAYVEFLEPEAVDNALKLTNSTLGDRPIKVARKRTNEAGVSSRGRGGRGRGRGRGRGGFPGFGMPFMPMGYAPYPMPYMPMAGGFRGRGRGRGSGARGGRASRGTPAAE